MKIKHRIQIALFPPLAAIIMRILWHTLRVETLHADKIERFWEKDIKAIGAFWHGRLLMMSFCYHGKGARILISRNRDGELIARVLNKLGFSSIRGSTSRGGAEAMMEMVKSMKDYDIVITPDGPRGPKNKVKEGVITLARLTGAPIIPVSFGSSRKIVFKSWDEFNLPCPFSRAAFIWGDAIYVKMDDDTELKRRELENSLQELTEYVDNYVMGKRS